MNKLLSISALLIGVALVLSSCNNKTQKHAIQKIDSLIALNDQVYKELSTVNIDSIKMMFDTVKKYDDYFATPQISSIINEKNLILMYEYGTIDKTFKKFLNKHYEQMLESLRHRRQQLEHLKQDTENGIMNDSTLLVYLHTEDSLMNFTANDIRGRISFLEQHKQKYYRYHPEILKLIDSIENSK